MYVVTMKFTVRADAEEQAPAVFEAVVAEIAKHEPATVTFAFHKHKRDERAYFLYEVYEDKTAFQSHLERRTTSSAAAALNELIDERGDVERYELVAKIRQ